MPDNEINSGTTAAPEILRVSKLVKLYHGASVPAVNGLDLTVRQGEIFGLLGPNGAGKTTAISIICTLLRPTSGTVTLHNHDVVTYPAAVRPLFGLAPQDIALYPSLTGRENLRYFGRLYGLNGHKLTERIIACLALVGLADNADARVDSYSGGMKRRANLAAAILHAPQLLLLDEPTVGIDAQSRNMLLENLKGLRDAGMTIIYTTHYMEEAQQLCSRIAIMDRGAVITSGTPAALIAGTAGCNNLEDVFLHLTGKQLRD